MAEAPIWQPNPVPAAAHNEDAAPAADSAPDAGAPLVKEPARARRAGSTTALLVIAAMVAIGGVGFATGRATAPAQSGTGATTASAANGLPAVGANSGGAPALGAIPSGVVPGLDDRGGPGNGDFGASTITGTVVSTTSSSITIKLASGQTVTVATGSSTTYHAQTAASSTDVTAGASVVVQTSAAGSTTAGAAGPEGAAGSRTATNVVVTGK